MRRREFITLLGGAAIAWPLAARAQQPTVPVIGFLANTDLALIAHLLKAFRDGLRDHGYVEGQNLFIEYRWAEGTLESRPELAAELVRLKVDLVFAWGTPATAAARRATSTIPIVMVNVGDPVGAGFVASLARPGGNITGVTNFAGDLVVKLVEFLVQVAPGNNRVALLGNPANVLSVLQLKQAETAVRALGLQLHLAEVHAPSDFESAFENIAKARAAGVVLLADPMIVSHRQLVAELAIKHRVPSIFTTKEYAEVGGLMSYGTNIGDMFRQVGAYSGRILKGAKPADLPVVQATEFELVINLQTARMLGLDVPPTLLARADEVIE